MSTSPASAQVPPRGPQHFADRVWLAARARNALRKPARLVLIGAVLGVGVMALLIFLPRQSQRQVAQLLPDEQEWQDTIPLSEALAMRREALRAAESGLAATRDSAERQRSVAPPAPRVLTAGEAAISDSLRRVISELENLLLRVEAAPLIASYRALGEAEALANAPEVGALVDSLAEVEQRRDTFGAAGGTDPVYVALTSRASELGRAVHSAAEQELESATAALNELRRPQGPVHPLLRMQPVDTAAAMTRVALAREQLRVSLDSLEVAVIRNRDYVARLAAARRQEVSPAHPLAVLFAGLAVGLGLAYLLALVSEMRRPHLGSIAEIERLSGARVLTLAGPRHEVADRNRRRDDNDIVLPLITSGSRSYRSIYLHLTTPGAVVPMITVTGPDIALNGVVAANLAVAAAHDGRATLLVDLDEAGVASGLVMSPGDAGVRDVRAGTIEWAEAVNSIHTGRGRLLDAIGAGTDSDAEQVVPQAEPSGSHRPSAESLRRSLTRMSRRYNLTVLSAPLAEAGKGNDGLISEPDAIITVTMGVTTHHALLNAVQEASGGGLRIRGIVVWDDAPIRLRSSSQPLNFRLSARMVPRHFRAPQ